MKQTIYISAPITGLDSQIVKAAFDKATTLLQEQGFSTINPLNLLKSPTATYGEYMGVDIQHIIDHADGVYFCRGWQNSKGCTLEYYAARTYNKDLIFE